MVLSAVPAVLHPSPFCIEVFLVHYHAQSSIFSISSVITVWKLVAIFRTLFHCLQM